MNYNILTCADAAYYPLALGLAENIRQFADCRLFLYDLGLTEAQRKKLEARHVQLEYTDFDPSTFQYNSKNNIRTVHKIDCIENFIRRYNENILVLDSDILLIEHVAPFLWPLDDQIVLTSRHQRERKPHILVNGKINAGVMAFGCAVPPAFFKAWRTLCEDKEHTDQSAVSALVDPYLDWDLLDVPQSTPYGTIVLRDGNVYNDVTCRSGKIFHFKNAGRRSNKRIGYTLFSLVQRLLPKAVAALIRWNRKHEFYVWKP